MRSVVSAECDMKYTWTSRQLFELVNHVSLDPVRSMRVEIFQGGSMTNTLIWHHESQHCSSSKSYTRNWKIKLKLAGLVLFVGLFSRKELTQSKLLETEVTVLVMGDGDAP